MFKSPKQIKEMESQLDALTHENSKLWKHNDQLTMDITAHQQEHKKLQSVNKELKAIIIKHRSAIQDYKVAYQNLKEKTLSVEQQNSLELQEEANQLLKHLDHMKQLSQQDLEQIKDEKTEVQQELALLNKMLYDLRKEVVDYNGLINHEDIALYQPHYPEIANVETKQAISDNRQQQITLIERQQAILSTDSTNNPPLSQHNPDVKLLLHTFNSDCENATLHMTSVQLNAAKQRIMSSYKNLNALFEEKNLTISPKYLDLKLAELNIINKQQVIKMQQILKIDESLNNTALEDYAGYIYIVSDRKILGPRTFKIGITQCATPDELLATLIADTNPEEGHTYYVQAFLFADNIKDAYTQFVAPFNHQYVSETLHSGLIYTTLDIIKHHLEAVSASVDLTTLEFDTRIPMLPSKPIIVPTETPESSIEIGYHTNKT